MHKKHPVYVLTPCSMNDILRVLQELSCVFMVFYITSGSLWTDELVSLDLAFAF